MFLVRESSNDTGVVFAERILQLTLLIALAATVASGWLVAQESRQLSAWLNRSEPVSIDVLRSLRREVWGQFVASVSVAGVIIAAQLGTWWLRRKYIESQQALRQVKHLAHDVLASMTIGVITTDGDGTITSINLAAVQLLGAPPDCVGAPLWQLSSHATPLWTVYQQIHQGESALLEKHFQLVRAGRTVRLRVSGHPLRDPQDVTLGCVIYLEDVTERHLVEERMRRMERFIELGTLASGLHHEIKNPLTALSIHVQLLEESLVGGAPTATLIEFVDVLKTEMARLNRVLENFRTFADLGRLSVQATDVVGLVHDAVRLIGPQATSQGVQISVAVPERGLPEVPLDAEKFQQAILNLMINALEAMPHGGHLQVDLHVDDGWLVARIGDTGPGIPPEVQPNVFKPYFSTKPSGTGLGLALTEKLIGQHGGHVTFRTGPGGTTFEIRIPVERVQSEPCATQVFES